MKEGDFVKISYTGKVKGGEIFDTTDEKTAKEAGIFKKNAGYGPAIVVVGAGHVFEGLDKVLKKMKAGEKKKVTLKPEEAFGKRDAEKKQKLPLKYFKNQNVKPKQGMAVQMGGALGRIESVSGGRVTVDFNHPLAGKNLVYNVKVEEKIKKNEEKVKGLLSLHLRSLEGLEIEAKKTKATITVPEGMNLPPAVMKAVAQDLKKWTSIKSAEFVYAFA